MPKSVQMNLCKFMERQPFIWSFNMRGLSICPACYSWPHPTRKDQQNRTSAVGPARSPGWIVRAKLAPSLSLSLSQRLFRLFAYCFSLLLGYADELFSFVYTICLPFSTALQTARGPCDVWKFPQREGLAIGVLAPSGGSDGRLRSTCPSGLEGLVVVCGRLRLLFAFVLLLVQGRCAGCCPHVLQK